MTAEAEGPAVAANDVDVVQRLYYLIDMGEFAEACLLFREDCEFSRPGYEVFKGRIEVEAFYSETRLVATGRHRIRRVVQEHPAVAAEGTFDAVLKSGVRIASSFCDLFDFEEGLIARRRTYYYVPGAQRVGNEESPSER